MINHRISPTDPVIQAARPSLLGRFTRQIKRLTRSENGTATVEFVLAIPVVMTVLFASVESGVFMTRYVVLEQSLDMVMRNLRLGEYTDVNVAQLKSEICDHSALLKDCTENLTIELQPISTSTWAFPAESTACVDRDAQVTPTTTFNPGTVHQIMLVRACLIQNAVFPSTWLGLKLAQDDQGGYAMVAKSAFVNEP